MILRKMLANIFIKAFILFSIILNCHVLSFEVNVADDFGFDETDSTNFIQAAIDSGATKVVIPNVGKEWIVSKTINIASNQDIYFEPGVIIAARKGYFKDRREALISIDNQKNISIHGYGAVLKMNKTDYMGPEYEKGEWRHTLQILSSENVEILGLTCRDSGGDGIYIGRSSIQGSKNYCQNIVIRDVVCDNNYRQGISVITAKNLLIENCVLKNTSGTPPKAGIDFEPNQAYESLVNCIVRNCISENNEGAGFIVHTTKFKTDSEPIGVKFENCKVRNCSSGFVFSGPYKDGAGGLIEVIGCEVEQVRSTGFSIRYKDKSNAKIRFKDCVLRNIVGQAPIYFETGWPERTKCVGGVEFIDCVVIHDSPNPFITVGGSNNFGIYDITGNIIVKSPYPPTVALGATSPDDFQVEIINEPLETEEEYKAVILQDKYIPNERLAIRYEAEYLLYADKNDTVELNITCRKLGSYEDDLRCIVISPKNESFIEEIVLPRETKKLTFKADEDGVYRVVCYSRKNAFYIEANKKLGARIKGNKVNLVTPSGYLYFWLPVGLQSTEIRVEGQGLESVKAALMNSKGEVIDEKDNISGVAPHIFKINLEKPSSGELWALQLGRASSGFLEDVIIIFEPSVPTISFSPGIAFELK